MIKTYNIMYHARTQEQYDWLMEQLEDADCYWYGGRLATQEKYSYSSSSDIYIWVEDKTIAFTFADIDFYEGNSKFKDYEFIEVSDIMPKYKDTAGKPKLSLVPPQIIFDVAEVREYGNAKYPDGGKDNWKKVDIDDYKDALLRHTMKYLQDPKSKDEESGIEHYKHMACNMAFICEMEK